jgi:hypothetical protein
MQMDDMVIISVDDHAIGQARRPIASGDIERTLAAA